LVVDVASTPPTTHDSKVVGVIHADLAANDVLPAEPLVDQGYMDTELVPTSQTEYGVDLIGPVPVDQSWQATAARAGRSSTATDGRLQSTVRLASRYRGHPGSRDQRLRPASGTLSRLPKTELQQVPIAMAMNLVRLVAWFTHPTHSQTQISRFVALAPAVGEFANNIINFRTDP
jgi:hypothetical protein